MARKLYLSETDKKLAGVCGGIAEYFAIDSTLVRLGWVIFSLAWGSGVLGYIIAALVIPRKYYY
ncbi:PspC domain-containing protein [Clostridium formicaceticum]|nr:PspC domain-containing protein [Clostridium formicaceticum]AOY76267.1 PspC domain-containing protein [Clostridium formicaceticum]